MPAGLYERQISWQPSFRFPGQYQDPDMGLSATGASLFVQNHYREYMPGLGRYNRVDPIINMKMKYKLKADNYYYAQNDPIRFYDFMGLLKSCCMPEISNELHGIDFNYFQFIISKWYDPNYRGGFIEGWKWWLGVPNQVCADVAFQLADYINAQNYSCCEARPYFMAALSNTVTEIHCNYQGFTTVFKTYDPEMDLFFKPLY
jgi:RHS repeat-associated protein